MSKTLMSSTLTANMARFILAAWVVALCASIAPAQQLDLGLNLLYTNQADDTSGGTWQLVAKSTDFGIAGLNVLLADVNESTADSHAPKGTVNGDDPAGFDSFVSFDAGAYSAYVLLQAPIASELEPGDEESIFYGVGSVANGSPGDVGPALTTLTGASNIPWATGDIFGDAAWDTGVLFVTGEFSPGDIPSFYTLAPASTGTLWATVGNSTTVGTLDNSPTITTTVRDNLVGLPDYNLDGVVDGADYTVWRDTEGLTGPGLAADGTGDMIVDQADYDLWALNFGAIVPPGAGAGGSISGPAVPEPASWILLLGMSLISVYFGRFRPVFRQFDGLLDSYEKATFDVETA